ncbi:S8 family serine peptidase [Cellulomonas sp. P24]|uniref:S8 family serine peptidase n=1 Tax=Cellulomonas sp. P24 TaxID=2885206 RepID=UPI00216ADDC2|nr:S8 family serine peptidase [Cellulomonas sp. P24]MCR6490886.1 S8 family serine peptidase [Cellulomonas sp. P24]
MLTTRLQRPGEGFFTTTRDTSAATAQVAAIAADIQAAYPTLRPETVRALIVHSAEWTPAMSVRLDAATTMGRRVSLLRRYGMGVPNAGRALRSAADALTLIAEARIHPYERDGASNAGKVREMNLHDLPWPVQELENLGETQVRLRITLSYFVEPNPQAAAGPGGISTLRTGFDSRPGVLRRASSHSVSASTRAHGKTASVRRASTPNRAGHSGATSSRHQAPAHGHLARNSGRAGEQGSHRRLSGRRLVEEPGNVRSEPGGRLLARREHRVA